MKLASLLSILLLTLALPVSAAEVDLRWDAPEEGPAPAGYSLQVNRDNDKPFLSLTVFGTEASVELPVGKYKITVSSIASGNWTTNAITGEITGTDVVLASEPSNEVSISVRPAPSLKIKLQGATDLSGVWTDIGIVASYDLRNVNQQYVRAMLIHEPPSPMAEK
jgi:hypothetical protein